MGIWGLPLNVHEIVVPQTPGSVKTFPSETDKNEQQITGEHTYVSTCWLNHPLFAKFPSENESYKITTTT